MPRIKKPDRLSQYAAKARSEGMTYGKWMAINHPTLSSEKREKPKSRPNATVYHRVCPYCGTPFDTTRRLKTYCRAECTAAAHEQRRKLAKATKSKEEDNQC